MKKKCIDCPRNCLIENGFCGKGGQMKLALAVLHFGEEPPLSGKGGSGALFFSGCNLRCPFCQNWQISRGNLGREIANEELIAIFLTLQEAGAENINLVTGVAWTENIFKALGDARERGLVVPVIWNSSGYETQVLIDRISLQTDVFLPDLKTLDSELSKRLFDCADYPETALAAIDRMVDKKALVYDGDKLVQGVIIRHLVIPGEIQSSLDVFASIAERWKDRTLFSLMAQYTPVYIPGETRKIPENFLSLDEYDEILIALDHYGLSEGFVQEWYPDSDWLPDFTRENPFSSELARVIWHYRGGFV